MSKVPLYGGDVLTTAHVFLTAQGYLTHGRHMSAVSHYLGIGIRGE